MTFVLCVSRWWAAEICVNCMSRFYFLSSPPKRNFDGVALIRFFGTAHTPSLSDVWNRFEYTRSLCLSLTPLLGRPEASSQFRIRRTKMAKACDNQQEIILLSFYYLHQMLKWLLMKLSSTSTSTSTMASGDDCTNVHAMTTKHTTTEFLSISFVLPVSRIVYILFTEKRTNERTIRFLLFA